MKVLFVYETTAIVRHYVDKAGIDNEADWELVRGESLRWALERASRSGRVARQYVDDLVGRLALEHEQRAARHAVERDARAGTFR